MKERKTRSRAIWLCSIVLPSTCLVCPFPPSLASCPPSSSPPSLSSRPSAPLLVIDVSVLSASFSPVFSSLLVFPPPRFPLPPRYFRPPPPRRCCSSSSSLPPPPPPRSVLPPRRLCPPSPRLSSLLNYPHRLCPDPRRFPCLRRCLALNSPVAVVVVTVGVVVTVAVVVVAVIVILFVLVVVLGIVSPHGCRKQTMTTVVVCVS